MSDSPVLHNAFKYLFLNDIPFLDVRAPIEFAGESFPTAYNYPLLNTTERQQVGLCYRQYGQQAAVELGYKLISGEVRTQCICAWRQFIASHTNAYLYCWRGGMRSRLVRQALKGRGN